MQTVFLSFVLILVLALAGVGVGLLAARLRPLPPAAPMPLPVQWALIPRPVFGIQERGVYHLLREALPHHTILAKLPLVRFCQPIEPEQVLYWYALLGTAHVTFAVCSANGRVLAAVDLDSVRSDSPRTLQIKQAVLAACRVRYLRCAPDRLPTVAELQLLVPQDGNTPRGPQAAPPAGHPLREATHNLTHTVAARRAGRTALWQDPPFLQDFFASGSAAAAAPMGAQGEDHLDTGPRLWNDASEDGPHSDDDIGGIVIDTPPHPARR